MKISLDKDNKESKKYYSLWKEEQKKNRRLNIFIGFTIFCLCGMLWLNMKCYGSNSQLFNEDLASIKTELDLISASDTDREITVPIEGLKSAPGPLSIPSFLWGCAFGFAGIVVVHSCTGSEEESKKALKGCLINGAGILAVNIILLIL